MGLWRNADRAPAIDVKCMANGLKHSRQSTAPFRAYLARATRCIARGARAHGPAERDIGGGHTLDPYNRARARADDGKHRRVAPFHYGFDTPQLQAVAEKSPDTVVVHSIGPLRISSEILRNR